MTEPAYDHDGEPSPEMRRRWWPFVGLSLLVWPAYYAGALLLTTLLLDRLDRSPAQLVALALILPLLLGASWGVLGIFRHRGGRPLWLAMLVAVPGALFVVFFGGGLLWSWLATSG